MRTSRLRQRIKKYLLENGQANTTEISEYVNSTMRHGCTMQQLGNVLSKDKDITKVGTIRKAGSLSGRYEMCIWSLSSHYAVETEQTYNELKDKIIQWLDTQEPGTYLPKQIKKGINIQKVPSQVFSMVYQDSPEWLSIANDRKNRGRVYEVLPRT